MHEKNDKSRIRAYKAYVVVAVVLTAIVSFYSNRRIAFQKYTIYWSHIGSPCVIVCSSVDGDDKPISGQRLNFVTSSGGNIVETNENGLARINVGETDLEKIEIDGNIVYENENSYWFGNPHIAKGLFIHIKTDK